MRERREVHATGTVWEVRAMSRNAGVGVGAVVGVGGRQRGKWKLLTPEKPTSLAKPWGFGGGVVNYSCL